MPLLATDEILLPVSHATWLVGLSLLVSVLAATLAMQLAGTAQRARSSRQRHVALASGAFVLGGGAWAMHFVGMEALDLGVAVRHDPLLTVASVLPALLASWIALRQLTQARPRPGDIALSGASMSLGMGGTHYLGMLGLETSARMLYDPRGIAIALAGGALLSMLSLWLGFGRPAAKSGSRRMARTLLAGLTAGLGIAALHYLAIAGTSFIGRPEPGHVAHDAHFAVDIAFVIFVLLLAAFLANTVLAYFHTAQELREKEERLRAVMDTAVDGLITMDRNGRILSVNRATETLLGWSAGEMLGRNVGILMSEPERSQDGQLTRFLLGSENVAGKNCELLARHKDGREIPVRLAIGRGDHADEAFYVGVLTDITEQRETQRRERVAKSEVLSFMSALTEHSLYSETDSEGTITRVNAAFAAISGYTESELIGKNHNLFGSGSHPPEFWSQMWRTVRAGKPWKGEVCNRARNGRLYWVDTLIAPVLDDKGAIRRIVAIRHDITQRKTNELVLAKTQKALEASHRAARIGTWECTLEQGQPQFSAIARELLELGPGRQTDSRLLLERAEAYPELRAAVLRALQTGQPWDLEIEYALEPGRTRWLRVVGQSEMRADRCARLFGTLQDIDEAKRREIDLAEARAAAEEGSRSKDRFLATMSHELRTPMNAIIGFGQILERDPRLAADQREDIVEILNAAKHLLELINDVLDLARISSGQLEVTLEPVELRATMHECFALVQPLVQRRRLRLKDDLAAAGWLVADPKRLKQALLNLLSNAVKYNREGGEIRVEVLPPRDGVQRVQVSDTGLGIPQQRLAELFKPFSRLGADNSGIEGTGMGLSITRQLVELMRGQIGVDSREGVGSCFWIELPVLSGLPSGQTAALAAPVASIEASADGERHRILYVDDNPANLKLVQRMLERQARFSVDKADSASGGLERARQSRPDLILLDINMPGMNGYEMLEALKADPELRSIPVVAMTANAMPGDMERALAAGFSGYLTKPFEIRQLLSTLEGMLQPVSPA